MTILEEVSVLEHTDLIIGGKARPTAERVEVLDPSTGKPMAAIAWATPDDIDDAIAAARGAQKAWSRLLPRDRAQVLYGTARLIREHGAELAKIESLDTGKALKQAKSDVEVAAQYFEFYAGLADKFYGTTMPMGGDSFSMTFREPMGVAAIIVPWNYPAPDRLPGHRPGAHDRQRRRPQTGLGGAAVRPLALGLPRPAGRAPGRCPQRDHRARLQGRELPEQPRRRRLHRLHRQRPHRLGRAGQRGQEREAGPARAGRQVAQRDPARRRPRPGRPGADQRLHPELGADVLGRAPGWSSTATSPTR